jgi:hypothetical protein
MKTTFLVLLASLVLVGCSKDGAGHRLAEGGQMAEPLPTDGNYPGPEN